MDILKNRVLYAGGLAWQNTRLEGLLCSPGDPVDFFGGRRCDSFFDQSDRRSDKK